MLLCSITFVRKNYFLNCRLGLTNVSLLYVNLHLLVTRDKVLAKISPISNNRKLIFDIIQPLQQSTIHSCYDSVDSQAESQLESAVKFCF